MPLLNTRELTTEVSPKEIFFKESLCHKASKNTTLYNLTEVNLTYSC